MVTCMPFGAELSNSVQVVLSHGQTMQVLIVKSTTIMLTSVVRQGRWRGTKGAAALGAAQGGAAQQVFCGHRGRVPQRRGCGT